MVDQLFIGRLPRSFRSRELEDIFYKYGRMTRCDVKQGEFYLTMYRVTDFRIMVFYISYVSLFVCLSCYIWKLLVKD